MMSTGPGPSAVADGESLRSGPIVSWMLMAVFFAFAAVLIAVPCIGAALSGEPWMLLGLPLAAGSLLLGAAIAVMALRRRAVVDSTGVQLVPPLGRTRVVPWEAVRIVRVPGRREPGKHVELHLHSGEVLTVEALSKSSADSGGPSPTPAYERGGQKLIAAHQRWLAAHAQR